MEYLPEKPYQRLLTIAGYAVIGTLFVFLLHRYIAPAIMPFLVAWVLALLLSPAVETLHRRTRLPKGLLSVILVVLMAAILCFILFRIGVEIYRETSEFIVYLASRGEGTFMETLSERFPFIRGITENETVLRIYSRLSAYGTAALGRVAETLFGKVTAILGGILSALPGSLIFLFVTLIAAVYFCGDFKGINRRIASLLPRGAAAFAVRVKNEVKRTLRGYARAYLILMGITFAEVFAGFLILRIDYALLFAAVIAVLDILPVIGAGTFLLPAAVWFLFSGDLYRGFGLAVLYIAVSVVRQIAEPKVVGKSLGLHPLLSLASIYAGYRLMGFAGIFIGPMLAIILKNLLTERREG